MELRSQFSLLSVALGVLLCCTWIAPTEADLAEHARMGPTISFKYCYSCGYRKAFEEYSQILQEKYPEIGAIHGENYDPPGMSLYLSKGVLITKLLLIFVLVTGFDLWGYIGQPVPGWWNWMVTNKIYAAMMIFFFGNMIEGNLISSGAFEIYFNDVPIWSKLQSGRVPAATELFQIIDNQLKFSAPMDVNPNFVK